MRYGWWLIMSRIKIELNRSAVGDLLKSAEMQTILKEHAQNIASETGGEVECFVSGTRAVAAAKGDDGNNGLLKAMRK